MLKGRLSLQQEGQCEKTPRRREIILGVRKRSGNKWNKMPVSCVNNVRMHAVFNTILIRFGHPLTVYKSHG
jgi:hypothetical protein